MLLAHSFAAMRYDNIQERGTIKGSYLLMVENMGKGKKRTLKQS